ncbi:hypothetical protein [Streptomyces flaveolus]|uniref:hypothetical protein n=1 Tax=Streptomyces flaveolus TaxID=67297 RepID=UPI0034127486
MADSELTPRMLRERAENELRPVAQRRVELLAELEEIDSKLRPLVRKAVAAEVSYRRISSLSGLSPTTIRAWSRDPGE